VSLKPKVLRTEKRLDNVMRVHTHDYIKGCFSFLNSTGWVKKGDRQKGLVVCRWWSVASYVL